MPDLRWRCLFWPANRKIRCWLEKEGKGRFTPEIEKVSRAGIKIARGRTGKHRCCGEGAGPDPLKAPLMFTVSILPFKPP